MVTAPVPPPSETFVPAEEAGPAWVSVAVAIAAVVFVAAAVTLILMRRRQ
ncbi:MAG: hypothetical protein IIC89_07905 [Chloroflexi bacterium]|nr:hypothetical protein [Chloroflexota bacterium]